jgi:hypothetical protein
VKALALTRLQQRFLRILDRRMIHRGRKDAGTGILGCHHTPEYVRSYNRTVLLLLDELEDSDLQRLVAIARRRP